MTMKRRENASNSIYSQDSKTMRPRNNYEKRAAALNATLSEDIAASNAEWVRQASKEWDMTNFCYFTISDTICEFEVRRLYRAYKFTDSSTDHFFFVEIMREFSDGERKLYFGKQRTMGCYYDTFIYASSIELRSPRKNYSGYSIADLFQLSVDSRPESEGTRIPCETISPHEIARIICNNPVAENLYKQRDPLFRHLMYREYSKQTCRAITLAKRHGFAFNEMTTSLWFDMVHAIIYCKKDFRNPVYIAPKDLYATHDMFVSMMYRKQIKDAERRERRREQLRIQREYEQLQKELEENKTINEQYVKRRRRFYPMLLTDGLIECRVLRNVDEFRDEAEAMQHCVYRNRYFAKPYSLIISARIGEQRIETIEVDLTNYTVRQCYGKNNQFTMHHDRILSLINANMDTIRQYSSNRRKTKINLAV